jgi:hypothetical protein
MPENMLMEVNNDFGVNSDGDVCGRDATARCLKLGASISRF